MENEPLESEEEFISKVKIIMRYGNEKEKKKLMEVLKEQRNWRLLLEIIDDKEVDIRSKKRISEILIETFSKERELKKLEREKDYEMLLSIMQSEHFPKGIRNNAEPHLKEIALSILSETDELNIMETLRFVEILPKKLKEDGDIRKRLEELSSSISKSFKRKETKPKPRKNNLIRKLGSY